MEKVIDVAKYICDAYRAQSGERIDSLKLQKLIYFAQRESLAVTGEPLFMENLEGWVHGPVSPEVWSAFYDGDIDAETKDVSPMAMRILNNVIEEYGAYESWKLRELSHCEISWKNSRKGKGPKSPGKVPLKIEDIRKDAEKVRPFDYTWGMYYDQFDDYKDNKRDAA